MAAVKNKAKGLLGGGDGGGEGGQGRNLKVTNIVESIDVGVPVQVAYNQWTRFTEFPGFMKKVENVEQESDEKLNWKAQILWSHRSWESTIIQQVPDEKIVWRSKGAKGYVDGAVTFHELAPNLTRILLALEYHPQGFFEHAGNLWRAQGRRVRLELKHFRRQVMTEVITHPDGVEGWRKTIEDGAVTDGQGAAGDNSQGDNAEGNDEERESAEGESAERERTEPKSPQRGQKTVVRAQARKPAGSQAQSSSGSGGRAAGNDATSGSKSGGQPRGHTSAGGRDKRAAAGQDEAARPVRRRTASQQQERRPAAVRSARS